MSERKPAEQTTEKPTPAEKVGLAMCEYIRTTYGKWPCQEHFERMFWAWQDEVERIYEQ